MLFVWPELHTKERRRSLDPREEAVAMLPTG
jgi:hypothetical protein